MKELHNESGRKEMRASEVVTLPHYIKFSVLSVIKYTSEEGKTHIFMNQAIISFCEKSFHNQTVGESCSEKANYANEK